MSVSILTLTFPTSAGHRLIRGTNCRAKMPLFLTSGLFSLIDFDSSKAAMIF